MRPSPTRSRLSRSRPVPSRPFPSHRRPSRLALAGAAVLVPGALLLNAPLAAATPGALAPIPSTMPRWLVHTKSSMRAFATDTSEGQRLAVRVYLAPRGGEAAVQAKVDALSDPTSADYGHWLTPAQYQAAYAPTTATVASVTRYLKASGVTVTGVESARRYVSASGSVAQLQKAFHVSLQRFRHDGQTVTAPTSAAELPAALARSVLTVTGLDTTVHKMRPARAPQVTPPDAFVNARPCSISYGQIAARYQANYTTKLPTFRGRTLPYAVCGYTGPQLRAAYEGTTSLTGAGATVAIVDAYRWQYIAQDANRYAEQHGDGSYVKGQLSESTVKTYTHEKECDPSGWSGEETLDVEAVHAMAPDAKIRYYAAASCYDSDLNDALARVVHENRAQVVTNSYGEPEEGVGTDTIVADRQVVLQGATQGISFLFSSGDSGDELNNTAVKQADYPASLPEVTAVGGTATGIDSSGKRIFDAGWGTQKYTLSANGKSWESQGFMYGAGGGYSALFNQPAYQKGVVPASAPPFRAVPDIAMDADPTTGMLVGQTQTFPSGVHYGEYRIGGTSLASPLLAGMTALASQQAGGKRFGQLNPRLYANRSIATDVVPQPSRPGNVRVDFKNGVDASGGLNYTVRTFGQDSSLAVTKGWDPVTGIGVPTTRYFSQLGSAASAAVAMATH